MKSLKIALISLSAFLVVMFTTAIVILYWLVYNPQVVYKYVEKNYFPKDLKIVTQKYDYQVKHLRFDSFRFELNLVDTKVEKKEPDAQLLFDQIKLDLGIEFFKLKATVYDLQVISKSQSKIIFAADPTPEETPPQELDINGIINQTKSYLALINRYLSVEKIHVDLDALNIIPASGIAMDVAFNLFNTEDDHYNLQTEVKSNHHNLMAKADLFMPALRDNSEFLNLNIEYSNPNAQTSFTTSFKVKETTLVTSTKGKALYITKTHKIQIEPYLNLNINNQFITAKLNLSLDQLPGPIPTLTGLTADLKIPMTENYDFKQSLSTLNLKVPIKTDFVKAKTKLELEEKCDCKFPQKVIAFAKSKFLLPNILDNSGKSLDIGEAEVHFDTIKNKIFNLDLHAKAIVHKENNLYDLKPKIDLVAHIKRFIKLAPILDYFGIIIPAPLHVLDGQVTLKTKDVELTSTDYLLPLQIDVDLSSKKQKLKATDESEMKISKDFKKISLKNKVTLEDIVIELPDLKPTGGIPRLAGDSRIIIEEQLPAKGSATGSLPKNSQGNQKPQDSNTESSGPPLFEIGVDVESKNKDTVRLLSDYFKPHLPFNVQFQTTEDLKNKGVINIEPFNIVYLRRTVRLERMMVEVNKKIPDKIFVDGRFTVQQSFYKVFIDVNGDSEAPHITLTSDPELSRADIISVLLFDQTREQLVPSDVEVAGGVEAAFTSRALGLFSLWALSSTPIRSFNYNPVTNVYTATVVLGDGVTAGIGSDWESSAQFELRKRITKRWVLTGRWVSAGGNQRERSELILQWESRF